MSSSKILTEQSQSDLVSKGQGSSAVFVELYETDKNRLYAYIFAFVLDHAAADDIFQETSLILWREFAQFELGTNFSKWANGIAFNSIRNFLRVGKKYALDLDDDLLETLYQNSKDESQLSDNKQEKWLKLQHCTSLLPTTLKNIYSAFYVDNCKAEEVAQQTGRSVHGIRKSVHKLRKSLFDCIESKPSVDKK